MRITRPLAIRGQSLEFYHSTRGWGHWGRHGNQAGISTSSGPPA
ncbi:MAG TPA: hypothetical protein VGM76_03115 [Lacipirellulaceae bacterium]